MMKINIAANRFALLTICALGVLLPTESFADLTGIACRAIKRGCLGDCGINPTQECAGGCDTAYAYCILDGATKKQQTPPPPCTGVRCTIRNPHPPTTVSDPTQPRRPVKPKPVKPVSVSNPNKTGTGNSEPVILLRKNEPGGQRQGKGH